MAGFIDEIDRLFEVLVREAWRRPPGRLGAPSPTPVQTVEVQLPVRRTAHSDISFTTEGQRLTVTVRQRAGVTAEGPESVAGATEEHSQQTFTLPPDTEPVGVEARFEDDTLRIRITLRKR
jgi:HSP20 family molecular chaperone IbpA